MTKSSEMKGLMSVNNQSVERFLASTNSTRDIVHYIIRAGKRRKKRDVEFQIALWHLYTKWQPLWEMHPPKGMKTSDGTVLTSWYSFRCWLAGRVMESPNTLENYAFRIDRLKKAGLDWPTIVNMLVIAPTHVEMLVTKGGAVKLDLQPGQSLGEFINEELVPLSNPHEVGERIRQESGVPTIRLHTPVRDAQDGGIYFTVTVGWTEKTNDGLGDRTRLEDYKFKVLPVGAASRDARAIKEIRHRLHLEDRKQVKTDD